MITKDKPHYRAKYQNQLAEEITGTNIRTIQMYMRRNNATLASAIIHYLLDEPK